MLEDDEWTPTPEKSRCSLNRHHWVTVDIKETPGMRTITQRCPECGTQRVLPRRILPKLPRPVQHTRPEKSACHHIWFADKSEDNAAKTLRRMTHTCPKCGKVKTTVRRLLLPL